MSLVGRALRAAPARRSLGDTGLTLETAFGGMFSSNSEAGATVTIEKATGLTAVGAAIRRLSRDTGTMPLITSQGPADNRVPVPKDPTSVMLRKRWNPQMTATIGMTVAARHLIGWGQAFIGKDIVTTPSGFQEVIGLWPIAPERVTVTIQDGRKVYTVVTTGQGVKTYTNREIIHVLLDSHDGYRGISPIAQHREAMGHQLALHTYGAKSIDNRAVPAGYLRIKKALSDPSKKNKLRAEWDTLYRGSANAQRTAVLDEDAEFVGVSIPLVDAQFIEQIKAGIVEVAQMFNMPAHKLQGDTGGSLTYTTREGNQLEYLTDALRPVLVSFEEAFNADGWLFPPARQLSCSFDDHSLLRLDSLTKATIDQISTAGAPFRRPAEIRKDLGLSFDAAFDFVPKQAAPAAAKTGKGPADGSQG